MKNSPVQRREPASGAFSKSLAVRRLGGGGAANVGGLCRHWLSGLHRASLRKFCAVTASTHSSLAPHGPRSRKRASRNMRLRGANSISTFFRRRQVASYAGVSTSARAKSRESSSRSRRIFRATAFGQHPLCRGIRSRDELRRHRALQDVRARGTRRRADPVSCRIASYVERAEQCRRLSSQLWLGVGLKRLRPTFSLTQFLAFAKPSLIIDSGHSL